MGNDWDWDGAKPVYFLLLQPQLATLHQAWACHALGSLWEKESSGLPRPQGPIESIARSLETPAPPVEFVALHSEGANVPSRSRQL